MAEIGRGQQMVAYYLQRAILPETEKMPFAVKVTIPTTSPLADGVRRLVKAKKPSVSGRRAETGVQLARAARVLLRGFNAVLLRRGRVAPQRKCVGQVEADPLKIARGDPIV